MPAEYSTTAFRLVNATFHGVRDDIVNMTTEMVGPDFALDLQQRSAHVHAGRFRINAEHALIPGGGRFELDTRELDGQDVERRTVWRIAQTQVDEPVEVQAVGQVDIDWDDETPHSWQYQHNLLQRWRERFKMVGGGDHQFTEPQHVGSRGALDTLEALLYDKARTHAVVVITEDWADAGHYLVDPQTVADWLSGFAYVRTITQEFTRALSGKLGGKEFAVYNGAVRIYRPSFYRGGDASSHNPLFLRDQVQHEVECYTFHDTLFEAVQRKQRNRFTRPGPVFKQAQRIGRDLERVEAMGGQFDLATAVAAYSEAQHLLTKQQERIDRLERQVLSLEKKDVERSSLYDTLRELLNKADGVEVWTTALDAAAAVPLDSFSDSTVRRALAAVREYAERLAESDDYRLGYAPHLFFDMRTLNYKHAESTTTMGMYGEQRRFTRDGQTREVQSHLTLNSNSDRCVHLYFEADPAQRTVHVVYCGKHLPTATGTHNN